jgi:hypothetical protein
MRKEYFEWLCDFLDLDNLYSSYDRLLRLLFRTPFAYILDRDENRALDGIGLRYRFGYERGYEYYKEELFGPCSMLEMLIALSVRCEENIMDEPRIGNRTSQWFWGMIRTLGLGAMNDKYFDYDYCVDVLDRFMNRKYEPNGNGGLFCLKGTQEDLRNIEIWTQFLWYLDKFC